MTTSQISQQQPLPFSTTLHASSSEEDQFETTIYGCRSLKSSVRVHDETTAEKKDYLAGSNPSPFFIGCEKKEGSELILWLSVDEKGIAECSSGVLINRLDLKKVPGSSSFEYGPGVLLKMLDLLSTKFSNHLMDCQFHFHSSGGEKKTGTVVLRLAYSKKVSYTHNIYNLKTTGKYNEIGRGWSCVSRIDLSDNIYIITGNRAGGE